MAYPLFDSTRDRASAGRGMLTTLAVAVGVVGVVIAQLGRVAAPAVAPPAIPQPPVIPKPQVISDGGRRVIAVGRSGRSNRCDISGFANGVPTDFEVDTGDPNTADFPGSYVRKLSVTEPLDYFELSPGTRYGKIAVTKLRSISVGDVVWNNPEVSFFSDWDYSFGDDEIPLLGLPALKARGINVEFDGGDSCRLTVARNNRRAGS